MSSKCNSSGLTPTPRRPDEGRPSSIATQNIQVYVRVRPLSSDEKSARSTAVVSCPTQREISVQEKIASHTTKRFNFDKVFCDLTRQEDVYKTVAYPLLKQVLSGYNCTVFAYGQTGTGKTFTMEGLRDFDGCWEKDPDAGIIPRSLCDIFNYRDKNNLDPDSFQIKVSFLELYNEEIFDLLSKGMDLDRKHKIFEDSAKKGSVIVQGLEEVVVKSKESVLKILEEGSMKRQTAATKMNATSSRSHTIFTITVTKTEKSIVGQERYIEGKLNLVDLAGSENIGRSGAVDKRAREAGKINESLLTLGRVINSLVKREGHVPYRESKLTRLLQDSLGGRTKTSIIATVSPAAINVEETLSTLDYAYRAKNITNRPEVNQKIPVATKLAEMHLKLDQIRKELEDQRERDGGVFMSAEAKEEMEKKVVELEQLKKQFDELSNLFDLKTAENDALNENLSDTLAQLEAKSIILAKTQEEKEVQEYLVSRHVDTNKKINEQTSKLIKAADNQFEELDKLQNVRERKSQVESQNLSTLALFEKSAENRHDRMDSIVTDRSETQTKLSDQVKEGIEQVVQKGDSYAKTVVDESTSMDSNIRKITDDMNSACTKNLETETSFLSSVQENAKSDGDDLSTAFKSHLSKQEKIVHNMQSRVESVRDISQKFSKQHVDYAQSWKNGRLSSLNEMETTLLNASTKQEEHYVNAEEYASGMRTEILNLKEEITKEKTTENAIKAGMKAIQEGMKAMQEAFDSLIAEKESNTKKLEELECKLNLYDQEVKITKSIGKSTVEVLQVAKKSEIQTLEQTYTSAMETVEQYNEDHKASTTGLTSDMQTSLEEEEQFVDSCLTKEKARFQQIEKIFTERREQVVEETAKVQDMTKVIQDLSSHSLKRQESHQESFNDSVSTWQEETKKNIAICEQEIQDSDSKLRSEIALERSSQKKLFQEDLIRDKPSGETPMRKKDKTYPRNPIEGTPDEIRARQFRQKRDLSAAVRLKIDEDEDDDDLASEDSVISTSTNVTESDVFTSGRNSDRGDVTNNRSDIIGSNTDLSVESEEVGYASDRENREPEGMFVKPLTSKLKPPKVYSSTSSNSAATRSRSSSRNRNKNNVLSH